MRSSRNIARGLTATAVVLVASSGIALPDYSVSRAAQEETPTAVIYVNTTADGDDGACNAANCTLREAIRAANAAPGSAIHFNIPYSQIYNNTVFRIQPASPLPAITANGTVVNGATQTAFTGDTNPDGPEVALQGTNAGAGADGLVIKASNCVVRELVINRWSGSGVKILSSNNIAMNNTVRGCYIGTDVRGLGGQANGNGVLVAASAQNNVIGGTEPGAGNLISGNYTDLADGAGVLISAEGTNGNVVRGNRIGLDRTGTGAIPNRYGVVIAGGAQGNVVGGTVAGARNLISGNAVAGVDIRDPNSNGNLVQGNIIGTDESTTLAIGNGLGVWVHSSNNFIGGPALEARNIISGNGSGGISIDGTNNSPVSNNRVQNNYVGTDFNGARPVPNGSTPTHAGIFLGKNASGNIVGGTVAGAGNLVAFNSGDGVTVGRTSVNVRHNWIRGNSIFQNGGLGINLQLNEPNNTVTPNDAGDADEGPNNLQNYPVLSRAGQAGNRTNVTGSLDSTGNTTFVIEFFANPECDASGHGEGRTFLGLAVVTTDAGGNASFRATLLTPPIVGQYVSATATRLDGDTNTDTSEFSNCVRVSRDLRG